LDKLYALARLLAVVVAIAAAFAEVPYLAAILLILGGIAGVGIGRDDRTHLYLATLVLVAASKLLEGFPAPAGTYLAAIFANLGVAFVGASIVNVTVGLLTRVKGDWLKSA